MPRQKFNSSSSESSAASLPKANFIASDNKKPGTSLKRKQPSSSSSDESDSENEQQNIKGKPQQIRLKQTKIELKTPVKQSKNISHKAQEQPNKNLKPKEEPNKKKQMENSKMMRVENHAEIEDQHERASSSNSVNAQHEAWPKPKEIYNLFKSIIDLGNDNKIHLAGKKANANLESLLKDQPDLDPAIDLAEMHNLFGKVYQQATKPSETPLVYALNHVMEYVQSESILKQYSDRPKPHKMWNIFLANNGKTPFNAGEELRQKFKNKEDIDVKRAEEEYNKGMETYIAQMREYLNQNKDNLFDSQIDYIQKKIKKVEKSFGNQKENGKEKAKGKGSKRTKNKEKVEKATPFELWKMTKEDKYPDLPEEQRNAKLLKMFNKLNEVEKGVFEKLAEGLNKKQSNE